MGSFTMRLQAVLDAEGDSGDGRKIGLADYPIPSYWTEDDRTALNQKIIGHYVLREIGQETVGLFCHFMRQRMWELMPAYVALYESTQREFDPFVTVKLETDRNDSAIENTTHSGSTSGTTDSTSGGRTVNSNTPSTMLDGDGNYADSAVDSNATTNGTSSSDTSDRGNVSNEANGKSTTSGYQGSPSDMLMKYRQTIVNIDRMIITDLYDMFFLVWDNTSEMLPDHGRGITY